MLDKKSFSNLTLPEKVNFKKLFMVYEMNVQLFLRQEVVFLIMVFPFEFIIFAIVTFLTRLLPVKHNVRNEMIQDKLNCILLPRNISRVASRYKND